MIACPHCHQPLTISDTGMASLREAANPVDEARLSAILGRAVAKQADTIAAQADQIVSLSKR